MFGLSKLRSRMRFKKRIRKPKPCKPIPQRSVFKVQNNLFKTYRQRIPSDRMKQWARDRQAEQLAKQWPAEMAFKAMLDRLGIAYEHQAILYRPGSFILVDFLVKSKSVAFELDGSSHAKQIGYDAGRDKWLAGTLGIVTIRIANMVMMRSPNLAEKIVRTALGL